MPVVLRHNGYRFHFYSDEGNPREPVHLHVEKAGKDAKLWLHPFVTVVYNNGIPSRDMAEIIRIIQRDRDTIERTWNAFFRS